MVMVLCLCAIGHGQEEKKTHSFLLDKWNMPLLITEGGAHVWSARGHNDLVNDELVAPLQIDPQFGPFYGVHNSYSYLKEFGIMSGAVSLAALLHAKGHHRWERVLLFADVGGALFQGLRDKRRYARVDCQFNHFDCH